MADQSRRVRVLEATAGLLSAGVLVIGVLLAVLALVAPALISGSGLAVTQGPRWDRILVPLFVGLAGELARRYRHRVEPRVRPLSAVVVVLVCLGALWWGWWR
ncbi:hypothetical protein [Nakamurella sp. PAMC28650]|uniref:hypothetical protein n=1 Tax=Nakamurella sp. PAMC28650 TaxID=2762325 RepID=UPI00164D80A1|nr:hypothetical protein [Nakamurella sp. PAMC28650]QNK80117.1 hypothetical protein H7F38_18115 [Nakamurella sp. PAMC28650]